MKQALLFSAAVLFASCSFDYGAEALNVSVPAVPDAWLSVLGDPDWLFCWYGPDGGERRAESAEGALSAAVPAAAASPIIAYPFWRRWGVEPGTVRPAGAIYPFGGSGGSLRLTWRGGVAGVFYRELLRASGDGGRSPAGFDWPRFASLLESDAIDAAVRADPWLVDWRSVAIRTRLSGFDRRRLKSRPTSSVTLHPPAGGPWVRASPFSAAAAATAEDGSLTLDAGDEADSLLSPQGTLRFTAGCSAWFPAP